MFQRGGRVLYGVASGAMQTFALSWRVEGEWLFIQDQNDPPVRSTFRFPSPAMLVLTRDGSRSVYVRT